MQKFAIYIISHCNLEVFYRKKMHNKTVFTQKDWYKKVFISNITLKLVT